MTQEPTPSPTQHRRVARDAIRAELEQTREQFHALLDSLPDEAWDRKSGNRAWTVRQLLWHIAAGVGLTVGGVGMAKQGRNFNPPRFIANRINTFTTKRGARNMDRAAIAEAYDQGHTRLIESLDEVKEDEWQRGSRVFGQYRTVEGHFHSVAEHLREHSTDLETVRRGSV